VAENFRPLSVYTTFSGTPSNYTATAFNTLGPSIAGQTTYVVDETPFEDSGIGGVVFWDRVYASLPSDRWEGASLSKNYMQVQRTYNNGVLVGIAVNSFSIPTGGFHRYFYVLSPFGVNLGSVPFAQVVNWPGTSVQQLNQYNGFNGDNLSWCQIDIQFRRWMGNIWEGRITYA
jgi:hypothetical protein